MLRRPSYDRPTPKNDARRSAQIRHGFYAGLGRTVASRHRGAGRTDHVGQIKRSRKRGDGKAGAPSASPHWLASVELFALKHNVRSYHLIWEMDMSKLLQIMMANGISLGNRYRWISQMEISPELEDQFEMLARKELDYVD